VSEAIAYNADLRVAAARVEQAAGYVKVAGAPLLPTLNVIGTAGSKSVAVAAWISGMLSAAWELDVRGTHPLRARSGRRSICLRRV